MKTSPSKPGVALFATTVAVLFVGASTTVSGNGAIRGRVTLSSPGTYTVGQDLGLATCDNSSSLITITSPGVVLDLDGHNLTGCAGVPVIDVALAGGCGQQIVIRDGRLTGGTSGIRAINGNPVPGAPGDGSCLRIERLVIAGATANGVDARYTSLSMTRATIRGVGGAGIFVENRASADQDWQEIVDSTIVGATGDAIHVLGGGAVTITSTTIRNPGGSGVVADASGMLDDPELLDLTADHTTIIGAGQDGFRVIGHAAVSIRGGLLRSIGRHGVFVTGSNQALAVKDLAAQDIGAIAVKLIGVRSATVTGNRLRRVGSAGPGGAGIEIDGNGGPAGVVDVSGNTIVGGGPEASGIRLLGGTAARATDNVVSAVAFGVSSWADDGAIADNHLRGIASAGIRVFGSGNVIGGNSIAGHETQDSPLLAPNGILIGPAAVGNLLDHNQVRHFAVGLHALGPTPALAAFAFRSNLLAGNTTPAIGGTDAGANLD